MSRVEHVYEGMRFGVTTISLPSPQPGAPPYRQKVLKFMAEDESEAHTFPLSEQSCDELARQLSQKIEPAPATAIGDLKEMLSQERARRG